MTTQHNSDQTGKPYRPITFLDTGESAGSGKKTDKDLSFKTKLAIGSIVGGLTVAGIASAVVVGERGKQLTQDQIAERHAVSELEAAPYGKRRIVHLGDKIKMANGKIVEMTDLTTIVDNAQIPNLSEAAGVTALTDQLKNRHIDVTQKLPAGLEIDLTPDAVIGDGPIS